MDFSSKKGGLDLGSEQVCTNKTHHIFTLSPSPPNILLPDAFIFTQSFLWKENLGIHYKSITVEEKQVSGHEANYQ